MANRRAQSPREPTRPSWGSSSTQGWCHPSGSSGCTPHQTLPLQQGQLRLRIRIMESVLEYQEEIFLALFLLNICLDSGQCPKGVCCPWVCYLKTERTFSQPEQGPSPFLLTSVCVAAFEPVWNVFSFVPRHSGGFQQPWENKVEREGQGDSLNIVSRDPQTFF